MANGPLRSPGLVSGMLLAALVVLACHDVPQAPGPPPPAGLQAQTLDLDSVRCGCGDEPGFWQGTELLTESDGTMHILSEDNWDGDIRYAGCSGSCDDRRRWWIGSADTGFNYLGTSIGAAITNSGITVVGSNLGPPSNSLSVWQCPGDCQFANHWQSANILTDGRISWDLGAHVHPLAADVAGGLHLAYFTLALYPSRFPLEYGYCPGACLNPGNWQAVLLDSTMVSDKPYQLRMDASGRVHLIYTAAGDQVVYATCPGSCLTRANWQSTAIQTAPPSGPGALSFVVTPTGGIRLADVAADSLRYGDCDSDCTSPGSWGWSSLRQILYGYDVSLGLGPDGVLHLATAEAGQLRIASCGARCDSAASWILVRADSAVATFVSLAVDRAGMPQVASSSNNLQYTFVR